MLSPQEPNVLACIPSSTSQNSQEYSTKDAQYVDHYWVQVHEDPSG